MSLPRLTRQLVLEAPERVADGAGGYTTNWRALGTLWAQIQPARGRAVEGGAGALSRVPLTMILRAHPVGHSGRPIAGQRLREGGRLYAVLSVSEWDASARYLELICEEEVAA